MSTAGAIVILLGVLSSLLLLAYATLLLLTPSQNPLTPEERKYLSPQSPDALPISTLSEAPQIDLSIVIPAYNERDRLPKMLDDTLLHIASASTPKRSFEIIVVDDGSKDDTSQVALRYTYDSKTLNHEIRVIKLARNRGKGFAVRTGVLASRGRRILMVDADGASRFADLERLWEALDTLPNQESAVAVGSRAHLVGTDVVVKRSKLRNLLMYSFHFILALLLPSPPNPTQPQIRDTQCGFKLFTRSAAKALFTPLHIQGWLFDVEVLLVASMLRIPVVEVPVGWKEVEGSKLNVVRDSLFMLRDLIVLRGNYLLGRWRVEDESMGS